MDAIFALGLVTVAFVILDVLAVAFGSESRDGFTGIARLPDRILPA
ncbi:MAG TPA: hypothetical protein VKR30_06060 [Candidatus Limnocylindrales bacterium]|nr:hypothetical protein [Candidatus Limnocylindrales bacterium]